MFTVVDHQTYVADPLSPKVAQLLRQMGRYNYSRFVACLSYLLGIVCVLVGIVFRIRGFTIPEEWYQAEDANDWIGVGIFGASVVTGFVAWWLTRFMGERHQEKLLQGLVEMGQAIRIPGKLKAIIDQRISKADCSDFVRMTYTCSPRDFEILGKLARAFRSGVVSREFENEHVDPLLDELMARITNQFQATQALHIGELDVLRNINPERFEG